MFFLLCTLFTATAEDFKTQGDGSTWTLSKLAATEGTGVSADGNTFTLTNNVEIAEGDKFEIESGIKVLMGDNVRLTLSGEADFAAGERVLITAAGEEDNPYGILVSNDKSVTRFSHIDFEYAGLKNFGIQGLEVHECTFKLHNAVSGTAALTLGTSGASFTVSDCTFEGCQRSAIGNAANYLNPVVIENCRFTGNGTKNMNAPQINLTVSENTIIRNNVIIGNPELNMVGGIVVSNLVGFTGALNTTLEGNEIRDNRFGLATYCEQYAVIRNNTIVGNKYEKNPNNGGSGINVYDPYKTQTAMITGNYIEDNLWGITVIGGKDINIGKTEDKTAEDYNPGLNVFLNNGNSGVAYDLYNNSANTVYAQGNYWKSVEVQDEAHIETVIFHQKDDASLGEVIFMPALTEEPTAIQDINGNEDILKVEVYAVNGSKVATQKDCNLSTLRPGLYTLRITTDKGTVTRKIIR